MSYKSKTDIYFYNIAGTSYNTITGATHNIKTGMTLYLRPFISLGNYINKVNKPNVFVMKHFYILESNINEYDKEKISIL